MCKKNYVIDRNGLAFSYSYSTSGRVEYIDRFELDIGGIVQTP